MQHVGTCRIAKQNTFKLLSYINTMKIDYPVDYG